MTNRSYPTKPCHNCRRQRLKCDRSHPHCHKCARAGQECLGYGELLRWNKGVASRGRMMGMTFGQSSQKDDKRATYIKKQTHEALHEFPSIEDSFPRLILHDSGSYQKSGDMIHNAELMIQTPHYCLLDPAFQDLTRDTRWHFSYFARHVCKDLVCYDVPHHNLFRDLIPQARAHPVLFHLIMAFSSLHMSNSTWRSIQKTSFILPSLGSMSSMSSPSSPLPLSFSPTQISNTYRQSLVSKQFALAALRQALSNTLQTDPDVLLATVLLFIEFELMDSGKKDWRSHLDGAKGLVDAVQSSCSFRNGNISWTFSSVVSYLAVYDVLGSTLACSVTEKPLYSDSLQMTTEIESARTNNYLSCPAILLQLVLRATELSNISPERSTIMPTSIIRTPAQQISRLLLAARSFDAVIWATDLQRSSPLGDTEKRVHIASAHKAAVCIYIARASSLFSEAIDPSNDLETLVTEVIHHLSFITADDGLFKATSWPTFIAGVETHDRANQEWAMRRLYEVWNFCPWNYIHGAAEILNMIWRKRDNNIVGSETSMNWIKELRSLGVDWLIV